MIHPDGARRLAESEVKAYEDPVLRSKKVRLALAARLWRSGMLIAMAAMITAIQTAVTREIDAFDPALVTPTRQEILYFGTPSGRTDLTDAELPVWVETGASLFYGVPGSNYRGFKVADDSRGAQFDPTDGDRTPSPEGIQAARNYMEHRFPAMRGAPLVEARVCQYEQSADGHLIVDTHPEAANAWIAGGGSGHGYKLGPALVEMLAAQALGEREKEHSFSLTRFPG